MNKMLCVGLLAGVVVAGCVAMAFADQSVIVANPSFQEQEFPVWPGYLGQVSEDGNATNPEAITGWTTLSGATGVNPITTRDPNTGEITELSYPFYDNGLIPDNNGLLFMQNPGTVTQTLSGFEPGKPYWLQFYVNARSSNGSQASPGDSGIPNASVFFDGVNLLGDGWTQPANRGLSDRASPTRWPPNRSNRALRSIARWSSAR